MRGKVFNTFKIVDDFLKSDLLLFLFSVGCGACIGNSFLQEAMDGKTQFLGTLGTGQFEILAETWGLDGHIQQYCDLLPPIS